MNTSMAARVVLALCGQDDARALVEAVIAEVVQMAAEAGRRQAGMEAQQQQQEEEQTAGELLATAISRDLAAAITSAAKEVATPNPTHYATVCSCRSSLSWSCLASRLRTRGATAPPAAGRALSGR